MPNKRAITVLVLLMLLLSMFSVAFAQVLSVSKTDLISNAPELDGKPAWLVIMSSNSAEKIVGRVNADQIKDDTGAEAKQGFSVSVDVKDYQCVYPIRSGYGYTKTLYKANMFKLGEKYGSYDKCPAEFEIACNNKNEGGHNAVCVPNKIGILKYEFYCIYFTAEATANLIDTPEQKFVADIVVERDDGQRETLTISNVGALVPESSSANVGVSAKTDNVYVSWVGNLGLGKGCPDPSNYYAIYHNGVWYSNTRVNVDKYFQNAYLELTNCINKFKLGETFLENCPSIYNTYLAVALDRVDISTVDGINSERVADYTEANNGRIVLHLDTMIQNPVFRFLIFADWLGVYVPVGYPEIISVEPDKIATGTNYVYVLIQNKGDVDDAFDVYLSCSDAVSPAYTRVVIPSRQSKWVALKVTASTNYDVSARCSVSVTNSLNTKKASHEFTLQVSPQTVCTPNTMRCSGNVIEKCNEAGTAWIKVSDCDYGCSMTVNGPICVTPEDTDGDGIPDYLDKCPKEYGYPIYDGCPRESGCAWYDVKCRLSNVLKENAITIITYLLIIVLILVIILKPVSIIKTINRVVK